MDRWIKSLSDRNEFVFVLVLAFLWPVYGSLSAVLSPQSSVRFDAAGLIGLLTLELPVLAVSATFLALRGWSFARLGPAPVWPDLPLGLGLAVLATIGFWILAAIASAAGFNLPPVEEVASISKGIGWPTILTVSAVNGFYEEVLVCGYLITAMRDKRSPWTAIHLSTAIRTAYHLYQGSVGVISIVPIGLLFAWIYSRTGRLWPLVVAHVLMDVAALAAYA